MARHGARIAALTGLVLAAAVLVRLADPAFLAAVRDLTFDFYQRARPAERAEVPVRVVDIDEASLARLGQWPWPRDRLAELTKALSGMGAAAVAFDIVFAEPDRASPARLVDLAGADTERRQRLAAALAGLPDNDVRFAEALTGAPSVIGFAVAATGAARPPRKAGFAHAGADPVGIVPAFAGATVPLAPLAEAAAGIGGVSLSAKDSTGVVRRVPLVFSDGAALYPALAVEALRLGFGASALKIRATGASGEAATGRPALVALQVGGATVPLTAEGELWLRYGRDRADLYVAAADVLDPEKRAALRPRIEGHVVFIGTSAAGLQDLRGTALGEAVPGVSIHAQAAAQMLAGDYLLRPDWADGLEVAGGAAAAVIFAGPLVFVGAAASLLIGLLAAAATVGATWWAFAAHGLLVDPVFPLATGLAAYLVATLALYVATDREKRFVRQAFGQYLAPDLVAELERSPAALKLGGETRVLTLLFMDVRGFTALAENLAPETVVAFLNALLTPVSEAIQRERGTIDKYIGDAVMAFWNAPLPVADHAAAACRAALAMRAALAELNDGGAFKALGLGPVGIGIGINTGRAAVGNMGSSRRFNYSVIGDAVNVAARIEAACKDVGADILVAGETAAAAPDFAYLAVGDMALKGRSRPLPLFALVGPAALKAEPAFQRLTAHHAAILAALAAGDGDKAAAELTAARALGIAGFSGRARALQRAVEALRAQESGSP
jgi:adenylate cyclase